MVFGGCGMSDGVEVGRLRLELVRLRRLVLENTGVVCGGERYWPEWVCEYFGCVGVGLGGVVAPCPPCSDVDLL